VKNHSSFLFVGFNYCAEKVLENLLLEYPESEFCLYAENIVPGKYPECRIVTRSISNNILDDIKVNLFSHILIFAEDGLEVINADVDARNIFTAIQINKLLKKDAQIIIELFNRNYTHLLRKYTSENVEIIYKERLDAYLIANTIVSPGKTSDMWMEIANNQGNTLSSITPAELGVTEAISLKDLNLKLLTKENPVIIMGYLPENSVIPILNPSLDTILQNNSTIYILKKDK
jgi:hypothetical protein